jgi:hypothetical protein
VLGAISGAVERFGARLVRAREGRRMDKHFSCSAMEGTLLGPTGLVGIFLKSANRSAFLAKISRSPDPSMALPRRKHRPPPPPGTLGSVRPQFP